MPRNLDKEQALADLRALGESAESGSQAAREFLRSFVERIQRIVENFLLPLRSEEGHKQ